MEHLSMSSMNAGAPTLLRNVLNHRPRDHPEPIFSRLVSRDLRAWLPPPPATSRGKFASRLRTWLAQSAKPTLSSPGVAVTLCPGCVRVQCLSSRLLSVAGLPHFRAFRVPSAVRHLAALTSMAFG
eukprot:CAMPEP_0202851964 /NCGR_PEP_ID=MMETSP1389-20130828/87740_1 /ASSEMBLY_ACC=CAM_ASM_000865 /TAXON_ID=302021 /ORGANISM="Rhodomonas sp., Strain CCMP768" /LENGTH=125 /DNA_ID=CAMNT_0049530353 /DNA_START=268 /DNA_END=641 /DNA_ORIENTATION=+